MARLFTDVKMIGDLAEPFVCCSRTFELVEFGWIREGSDYLDGALIGLGPLLRVALKAKEEEQRDEWKAVHGRGSRWHPTEKHDARTSFDQGSSPVAGNWPERLGTVWGRLFCPEIHRL